MGECSTCSVHSTLHPRWCDNWRPPPLPIDPLPQIYKTEFSRLLQNKSLKLTESLKYYAEKCPYHLSLDEITTTDETKTPTVATASFAGWLVLALLVVILVAAVGFFIYYKKKHGRYTLRGPCCRCFTSSGVSWAKLSSKYFRGYNSKEPETIEFGIGKLETKISVSGEEHINYASNENHEFLLTNQNGGSFEYQLNNVSVMPENNVTRVSQARPNDYVDYSNFSSVDTKDSPKRPERLSSEQENGIVDPTETHNNPETIIMAQDNKEKVSNESVKDLTTEPVKKRKKKFKLRHTNKIHSFPGRDSDQEIKIGQNEAERRKTY